MKKQYTLTSGKKLYEQVLERIKGMIAQGTYQKGDMLPSEKELMEMMGVSRITVREALRLLSEACVIETRKGKGSFILIDRTQLTPELMALKDYQRVFLHSTDARILLEPAIAQKAAAEASAEELKVLEECVCATLPEDAFHRTLIGMLHNPILLEWFDQLMKVEAYPVSALIPPARQRSISADFSDQHLKICKAIRNKNGEYAYFYMKEHLEYVRETYEEYFRLFFPAEGSK